MGELADRYAALHERVDPWSMPFGSGEREEWMLEQHAIRLAIAALEQRIATLQSAPTFGLADRIRAASARLDDLDVRTTGMESAREWSDITDELAAIAASADDIELRNASLAETNREVETENDQLATALYDACDGWRELWNAEIGADLPPRIAELEAVADGERTPTSRIVTDVPPEQAQIALVVSLREQLAAAEQRAEAAERNLAAMVGEVALGQRLLWLYSPKDNHAVKPQSLFACEDRGTTKLRVRVENHGDLPRILSVAVFERDATPDVTRLERRGTELIEAGERLLREYEERKNQKETV